MASLLKGISPGEQTSRGWRLAVDGVKIESVASMTLTHERLGTLTYGMTPDGYDTWACHERGGGGAVILPYVLLDGELHVLVLRELRRNQGGEVWNAPRGFLDPGEEPIDAATRELEEETGYVATGMFELPGEPCNPNGGFFDTSGPGEGVRFFSVEVASSDIVVDADGATLSPSARRRDAKHLAAMATEHIGESRFFPWTAASRLSDMFTLAAIARLLAHLDATATRDVPA